MTQVDKLEALLAKVQNNRVALGRGTLGDTPAMQVASTSAAVPSVPPTPPISQTPISVAPAAPVVESTPAPAIASIAPPVAESAPPAELLPPASDDAPLVEVGGPTDYPPTAEIQPKTLELPQVLVAGSSPWTVSGEVAAAQPSNFLALLDRSISLGAKAA